MELYTLYNLQKYTTLYTLYSLQNYRTIYTLYSLQNHGTIYTLYSLQNYGTTVFTLSIWTDRTNSVDPGHTLQNVTSDQDLHCLPVTQQFLDTSPGSIKNLALHKTHLFKF